MIDIGQLNQHVKDLNSDNTLLYDDKDIPSLMVRIPKFKISDVVEGGAACTHPAFVIDNIEYDEIYISKYQNVIIDHRAYSLPMQDPEVNIDFNQARIACENKGNGWHLMTNAEWAALALWCRKNKTIPRGNNNYGSNIYFPDEKGTSRYKYLKDGEEKVGRVATGSGPVSWAHDGSKNGIYDLNGNIFEWLAGVRLYRGEIQIIKDNDAAITGLNQGIKSDLWKAIMPDGSLVRPGIKGTLKFDGTGERGSGVAKITSSIESRSNGTTSASSVFESLLAEIEVPETLKNLCIFPYDCQAYGEDKIFVRNVGVRNMSRGCDWDDGSASGVFSCFLCDDEMYTGIDAGFRSAFMKLK